MPTFIGRTCLSSLSAVEARAYAYSRSPAASNDEEMREVCDSLVDRGSLVAVREGEGEPEPETDEVVGYLASEELRAAMLLRAAMN